METKKGTVVGMDETYLSFEFHRIMIAGLSLIGDKTDLSQGMKALVLGGGACILSKFLYHHFPESTIDTIELSNSIVKVCRALV